MLDTNDVDMSCLKFLLPVHTHITNSSVQSHSWKANSCSAGQ